MADKDAIVSSLTSRRRLSLADILIFAYIVLQSVLTAIFGGASRGYFLIFYFIAALLVGLLAILPHQNRPSLRHFIKTGYPLFFIYIFYRVAGLQSQHFGFGSHDHIFNNIEKTFFGLYPTFALQRVVEVWLNELSYILYILGILVLFRALSLLYRDGRLKIFESFVVSLEMSCLTCLVIATIFPVDGPGRSLKDYYYLGLYGPVFSVVVPYLIKIISNGSGSFPAFYFCIVTISSYYLWDFGKINIAVSYLALTAVFWGGIYLRYHYLADGLAAVVIAFIAASIASLAYQRTCGKFP